jgi:Tubulin-tyrosine ligase family
MKHSKAYEFVPKTYLLPHELTLLMKDSENKREGKKYYICKPNASSQGKGIYVTDNIQTILNRKLTDVLVSEYISNPLLINGKKFDLRIYVAMTSVNPLRFYIYEDGLVRFATENFTLNKENMNNNFVHLTNYSVNKHNEKYDG